MQDARLERDRLAGEAVGVALAVHALVVVADPRRDLAEAAALEDARAALGVRGDLVPLLVGRQLVLGEDRVVDVEVADVVQQPGQAHLVDLLAREPDELGDAGGQLGDGAAVVVAAAVLGVDGGRERRGEGVLPAPAARLERGDVELGRVHADLRGHALGGEQRGVGAAHEVARRRVHLADGHADRDARAVAAVLHAHRILHAMGEAMPGVGADARQDRGELVAAQAVARGARRRRRAARPRRRGCARRRPRGRGARSSA